MAEIHPAPGGLILHARAHPYVSIDHIGAANSGLGIIAQNHRPTSPLAGLARLRDNLLARLVGGRSGNSQVDAEDRAEEKKRVADVVAVAHPGELDLAQIAFVLPHGQQVRQSLAGMLGIGHRVDDRHTGGVGQLLDVSVREETRSDRVHRPPEHAGNVGDGLPLADPHIGRGKVDGMPAQLAHGDLEADSGAQRRLVEQQRQAAPARHGELLVGRDIARFLGGGHAPDLLDLLPCEIGDRKQTSAGKRSAHLALLRVHQGPGWRGPMRRRRHMR